MRRWCLRIFKIASLLLLCAGWALFIRSRFRADAITIVTRGRHCIRIMVADGSIDFHDQSPWYHPPAFLWTTGIAFYGWKEFVPDTLKGAGLSWADYRDPLFRHFFWHGVLLETGSASIVCSPNIDVPLRSWDYGGEVHWRPPSMTVRGMALPVWLLAVLASTPAVMIMLRTTVSWYRRHRRRIRGLCAQCGYDLRHTPERCPECGHAEVPALG